MGHFGGAVAPAVIGYILEYTANNWTIAFYASAAIYFLGALCWMPIDPVTCLDPATTLPRPCPHSPA
jgi:MFS transporter, ACS family, glucarate transporter